MGSPIASRSIGARPSIAARKVNPSRAVGGTAVQPYNCARKPGGWTFQPPTAGLWKFVGWSAGGNGNATDGGASGGYFEITRRVSLLDTVTIMVSDPASTAGTTTSVTFLSGTVATATRASGMTAGTATGGDVNLQGTAGTTANPGTAGSGLGTGGGAGGVSLGSYAPGAGAPANLPYRGGQGPAENYASAPIGAGAAGQSGGRGGEGLVIAVFMGS
jgi:hypothetical protein